MSGTEAIEIEVGGRVYTAKGSLRIGISQNQRHAVPDNLNEQQTTQFVEGRVVFDEAISGDMLRSMNGATVVYSEASGWRFTLRNARMYYANEGARPNQYEVKIVGETEN